MKLGRLVLTHRQELLLPLKEYYLTGGRTDFLVIAYNQALVNPGIMPQADNFKLFPFVGKGPGGSVSGNQFRVWPLAIEAFPEIEGWVVHDYDVLCKPPDKDIFSHIKKGEYAIVGKPIPLWQEGMSETDADYFPFGPEYRFWKKRLKTFPAQDAAEMGNIESILRQNFPALHEGINTIFCGYGDVLATSSKNFLLLKDSGLNDISHGGGEQVPFTVFNYFGIKAVDLANWYSMNISGDNTMYTDFKNKFDISHPVKFWPGGQQPAWKLRLKRFVKSLISPVRTVSWPKN